MDFKLVILVTLFITLTTAIYKSYDGYKVYKIVPTTEKDVKILRDLQKQNAYDFWTDSVREMSDVRIMVEEKKQKEFEEHLGNAGIDFIIAIDNVQKLIDAQLRRPNLNRINTDYAWEYYQNLEEIHEWLDNTIAAYPDVVTALNIGTVTAGGNLIRGVKIDYKRHENSTIGMIEGGIHAREWISPATVTWIIKEFLTSSDSEIRALAENIVWHIFPVVNPDGYAYTFTDNRMWRKNRNPENNGSCSWTHDDMSNGIDLNRNFGFMWMTTGASQDPCSEVYAGPTANSEVETRAIINHVNAIKEQGNLVYYLAFHSFSQMVLVPFSHVGGSDVLEAPNYANMFEIAIKGMDKLRERHDTVYTVGTSADILYEVSGSSFDWVKGVAEVPIVYLFELRDVGQYGFLLPVELIVDNNEEIMDGLVEMDRITRQIGYYSNAYAIRFCALLICLALTIVM